MRLIYLDTSHLSYLAALLAADPQRFAAFAAKWRATESVLVYSRVHLLESRRCVADERARRYKVVESLLPAISDIVRQNPPGGPLMFEDREILGVLWSKGMLRVEGPDVAAWLRQHTLPFPEIYATPEDVALFQAFEGDEFAQLNEQVLAVHTIATEAQKRPPGVPLEQTRLRQLAGPIPEAVEIPSAEEFLAMVRDEGAKMAALLRERGLSAPTVPEAILSKTLEPMFKFLETARNRPRDEAFLAHLQLTGARPRAGAYLADLTARSMFEDSVRRVLAERLNWTDPQIVEEVLGRIALHDCPGAWLERAVSLQARKAENEPEVSNVFDLQHLRFAPYVDLFFADKRTAEYTRQVLGRPDLPPALRRMPSPLAVSGTIAALEAALFPE